MTSRSNRNTGRQDHKAERFWRTIYPITCTKCRIFLSFSIKKLFVTQNFHKSILRLIIPITTCKMINK